MTPSKLKRNAQKAGSLHFDKKSMKFFGDTMKNYGVRTITVHGVEYWELYRKKPVKDGVCSSAYFDKKTFKKNIRIKKDVDQ